MNKTGSLFTEPPLLESIIGRDFFEKIPEVPGIYRFYDDQNNLLYVGKAKNLRRRLFTYKRVRSDTASGKVRRLVSRISSITYTQTATEEEALLEENRWIREHRPDFNHINKETGAYYYILTGQKDRTYHFRLTMNPKTDFRGTSANPMFNEDLDEESSEMKTRIYGCFKGHNIVRRSVGALLQLLWITENRVESPFQLPVQLVRNLTPLNWLMPVGINSVLKQDELSMLLDDWLQGRSNELTYRLFEMNENNFKTNRFHQAFLADRMDVMNTFFQKTLRRNYLIREKILKNDSTIIHQNELDDLVVKLIFSDLAKKKC